MSPTVLVTGASGFLGQALVRGLSAHGHGVRALSRAGAGPDLPGVTHHAYDLAAPVDPALLAGVDVAVHAAWVVHGDARQGAAVNLAGTRRLAEACRAAGARAIFVSSFSAVDDALSLYGRTKRAAEGCFAGPTDAILKPGLVAGHGGLFERLTAAMAAHPVVPLVGGGRPVQLIGIDDVVTAALSLLAQPAARTVWLAQPTPMRMSAFYRSLAATATRRPVLVPVPELAALAAARTAERLGIALPVTSDSVLGLRRMRVHDTRAGLATVGVAEATPEAVVRRYLPSAA